MKKKQLCLFVLIISLIIPSGLLAMSPKKGSLSSWKEHLLWGRTFIAPSDWQVNEIRYSKPGRNVKSSIVGVYFSPKTGNDSKEVTGEDIISVGGIGVISCSKRHTKCYDSGMGIIHTESNNSDILEVFDLMVEYLRDKYYVSLAQECRRSKTGAKCCLRSLERIKEGGYSLAPGKTLVESVCPQGFKRNMLKCKASYRWCEPE